MLYWSSKTPTLEPIYNKPKFISLFWSQKRQIKRSVSNRNMLKITKYYVDSIRVVRMLKLLETKIKLYLFPILTYTVYATLHFQNLFSKPRLR